MFPTTDEFLSQLRRNIENSLSQSLTPLAAINITKVVTRTPSRKSRLFPTIKLQIAITAEATYDIEALLDSGASATYISSTFVEDHNFPTRLLPSPIYAINADDTLNGTAITHQVKLTCHFQGHVSSEWFLVTNIGSKDMIIGMTWLRTHNPEIDWQTGQVQFTRCPSTCQGKRSLQSALQSALDSASQITEYSHYFDATKIYRLTHINAKETTSMRWSIDALKDKEVLTIEDIRAGPFKDFADISKKLPIRNSPLIDLGTIRSSSFLNGNPRSGNLIPIPSLTTNKSNSMRSLKKTLQADESDARNLPSPPPYFSSTKKMERNEW